MAQVAGLDEQRLLAAQRKRPRSEIRASWRGARRPSNASRGWEDKSPDWIAISCGCPKDVARWVASRRLQASCGKKVGYGRQREEGTALKTIDGVREALASGW